MSLKKEVGLNIKLQPPAVEKPFEYLSKRLNTKIFYCADVEGIMIDNNTTTLTLAKGYLHLLISESIKQQFTNIDILTVNQNICVTGDVFAYNGAFAIVINQPDQIWLSGH